MPRFLILFENSTGLSLFDCKGINEIAVQEKSVQESFIQFNLFSQQVKLLSFEPFKSSEVALETLTNITEGQVSDFMRDFLASVLPDQVKKHKSGIKLGVSEPKLAGAIQQQLGVECVSDNITREVLRAIRLHFTKFFDGSLTEEDVRAAQLGLSHGYSRAKVKFNQHGDDNMIISAIQLLQGLDKDLNTFGMRLREWYSIHFPELSRLVDDHNKYAKCVQLIGRRGPIDATELDAIIQDRNLTDKIIESSKNSIGRDIDEVDLSRIVSMAVRVADLADYKNDLQIYLHKRMHNISPNLTELIGERMGAQLIMASGSLTNLAKSPASTIQLLGSEKALFNALKKHKHTPKYGMIFNSGPVQAAAPEYKGRVARTFANKIAIAAKLDAFGDEFRSGHLGSMMRSMMDARLDALKTGHTIEPNLETMEKAVKETRRYEQNEGAEEVRENDGVIPQEVQQEQEQQEQHHRRRRKHHRSEENVQTNEVVQQQQQQVEEEEQKPPESPHRRKRRHSKTE
ncbi:nucleolar protein 5A [Histomonas meleagridis]|uniref:nucleolar protein 5A n=1 Tax=Histomonas meleagridis TaxID=135588 RepID=UPI00355966E3|nr:nucleolar protein 5A [Histomonas meleagridis]KAH0806997.1 nucleolar protein 5A [Histomonas meleagridis]